MLAHGHREVLGHTVPEFWQVMDTNFGVEPPAGHDAIAVALYGDECQAWQGTQLMCFHWTSETSPFAHDPARSRFLIACIPTNKYYVARKINVTVQALYAAICESMNVWQDGGVNGLFCRVTAIRGDWKYFTQILALCKQPSSNEICFLCNAAKSMDVPYTDLDSQALWRIQVPTCPWHVESSICKLNYFNLNLMALDILHIWYLGVGIDVAASMIIILMRKISFLDTMHLSFA